jgi:hypothetical protein
VLPWSFKDTTSQTSFDNFDEAFETYKRRVLILGAPGSGKTITLLHTALKLVGEAEKDISAPIPLLVNLSKFNPASSQARRLPLGLERVQAPDTQGPDKRIERWLASELAAWPFIHASLASKWLGEGRIAALLDGLDEVDDTHRAELSALLSATYLRDHYDAPVVICSRINEYKPLQEKDATKLTLAGSITLQPLTKPQIADYLERVNAKGLMEVLFNDETLYHIAQTPLTLSMLTLAYSGATVKEIPTSGTLTERRHQIMQTYVAKMLQRKARRDNGDLQKNVPESEYEYPPEQTDGYLGWLAVRLSIRMQTSFSRVRLHPFLKRDIQRESYPGVWWAAFFARVPLIALVAVVAGLVIAPMDAASWRIVGLSALAGMVSYLPVAWLLRSEPDAAARTEPKGFVSMARRALSTIFELGVSAAAGISAIGSVFFGVICVAVALSRMSGGGIPPAPAGTLALCAVAVIVVMITGFSAGARLAPAAFCLGSILVFIASIFAQRQFPEHGWYVSAVAVPVYQTIFAAAVAFKDDGLAFAGSVLILVSVLWGWMLFANDFDLDWRAALLVVVATSVWVLAIDERRFSILGGLLASFAAGAALWGVPGAALGMAAFAAVLPIGAMLTREDGGILAPCRSVVERIEDCGIRGVNPLLVLTLAVLRRVPARFGRFLDYGVEALLLKRSGGDVEFMHRLLRDYFALRDLQPALSSADRSRRLSAIRSLGYQGDAAVDALADFVRTADEDVREAAAWALGRINSPETVSHIAEALHDASARVRAAGALSSKGALTEDFDRLIMYVMHDRDPLVERALAEAMLSRGTVPFFMREDGDFSHTAAPEGPFLQRLQQEEELRIMLFDFITPDSDGSVARSAIAVAGFFKDRSAVGPLEKVLSWGKSGLRAEAARALGAIGDRAAAKALWRAALARDKKVRAAARAALVKMGVVGSPEEAGFMAIWRRFFP